MHGIRDSRNGSRIFAGIAAYHPDSASQTGKQHQCWGKPKRVSLWMENLFERALQRKQRRIDCFTSQEETLRGFPLDWERFRIAPQYDFQCLLTRHRCCMTAIPGE